MKRVKVRYFIEEGPKRREIALRDKFMTPPLQIGGLEIIVVNRSLQDDVYFGRNSLWTKLK